MPLNLPELAGAIAGAEPGLDPTEERIALAAYRLSAQGTPVSPVDVAATARASVPQMRLGHPVPAQDPGADREGDVHHPGAVVSFLLPDGAFEADIVQRFCHFVHFFATAEAGEAWVQEHRGTFLLSLEEAFVLGDLTIHRQFPTALEGAR